MEKWKEYLSLLTEDMLPHERALAIRLKMSEVFNLEYQNKNTDEFYLRFLQELEHFSFKRNGTQSCNHPYIYTLFTIKYQHVQGNSLAHCIDKCIIKDFR